MKYDECQPIHAPLRITLPLDAQDKWLLMPRSSVQEMTVECVIADSTLGNSELQSTSHLRRACILSNQELI